ncbi:MAG TPA: bifunctional shikimate kinase/3-dehydroquinate synthase [Solirubrobacteraceae bacterium]|nr:bifunctional shikimate kinase/3-dehydroquinate synthase [Solirubrobacteraceae bacterium]
MSTVSSERKLVFVGFMGAGKTTAAQLAAQARGGQVVDLDDLVVQRLGKPISQVFSEDGEAAFRQAEQALALEVLHSSEPGVVALGGGSVLHPAVREVLADHDVVWLDVEADTAWERAQGPHRPLAQDREAFEQLWAERQRHYLGVAKAIVPATPGVQLDSALEALAALPGGARLIWAFSASGQYPVYLGRGLLRGSFWPPSLPGRRFLVTDARVGELYGQSVEPPLGKVEIPPGEASKTLAQADRIWRGLARVRMTRADLVMALGGGVVGDLGGFCAATYQRGIRYVQMPTTLVAQVDSAYGGKTGVDLPEAKNYIGAYHQPSAVIVDTDVLASLPEAELAAGYAEVVKTALIAGGELWRQVSAGADPREPEVILGCALTKLRIVGRDERDGGVRQVLNLGHTVGHAIEAVTRYRRYRHGEAVALGLLAALRLSGQEELRQQVGELLRARRLPTSLNGVDPEAVVRATGSDKKRVGEGPVPFVLLDAPGRPRLDQSVPGDAVLDAVRELSSP